MDEATTVTEEALLRFIRTEEFVFACCSEPLKSLTISTGGMMRIYKADKIFYQTPFYKKAVSVYNEITLTPAPP